EIPPGVVVELPAELVDSSRAGHERPGIRGCRRPAKSGTSYMPFRRQVNSEVTDSLDFRSCERLTFSACPKAVSPSARGVFPRAVTDAEPGEVCLALGRPGVRRGLPPSRDIRPTW